MKPALLILLSLLQFIRLGQDRAQEQFDRFEKKYAATSLSVTVDGSFTYKYGEPRDHIVINYKGTLQAKAGGKVLVSVTDTVGGNSKTSVVKSDGKKLVIARGTSKETYGAKDGMTALLAGALTRGSWVFVRDALRKDNIPPVAELLPISELKIAKIEQLGTVEATVLEYVLLADKHTWKVTLWLDSGSLAPLKRHATADTADGPMVLSETYEKLSTDDLDDKLFSHN
jgi:hypothetical protein